MGYPKSFPGVSMHDSIPLSLSNSVMETYCRRRMSKGTDDKK